MTKEFTPDEIIDALGGTSEVARLCEIQPPSVSEWRKNSIPKAQLRFLRLLRPDVFGRIDAAPATRRATDPTAGPGHAGRQPASPHNILDTVPDRAVVTPPGETA